MNLLDMVRNVSARNDIKSTDTRVTITSVNDRTPINSTDSDPQELDCFSLVFECASEELEQDSQAFVSFAQHWESL